MPSNRSPDNSSILIIGGGGFVGIALANRFVTAQSTSAASTSGYSRVGVVDLGSQRPSTLHGDVDYHRADMMVARDLDGVLKSFKPSIVIIIASYGMSGSAMLDPTTTTINVNGVRNVINACQQNEVYRLIYTSSYNVIYGGDEIINGDESMEYFPVEKHSDYYSSSKAEAEKMVLNENGKIIGSSSNSNSNVFLTSVIRPAAIYGEGELRHFPRIVKLMDSGLFTFVVGDALVDWVHVENLVQAFEKLCNKLLQLDTKAVLHSKQHDASKTAPSGQAYFISDGSPVKNFEFFRPIFDARDVDFPTLRLSKMLMLKVGFLCEKIHLFFKAIGLHIEPFVTRAEVLKVGESHYFSINKAKTELGYKPTVDSFVGGQRMGKYYSEHFNNSNFFRISDLYLWVLIAFGMGILYHFANTSIDYSILSETNSQIWLPMDYLQQFSLFAFRSQANLRIVFDLAVVAHIIEAVYATYICVIDLKCTNTWYLWTMQTFCLGYGSLQYLQRRVAFLNKRNKAK